MKVFVVDNVLLYKDKNGDYYSKTIYSYEFLQRYLKVFDEVRFVAKTQNVDSIDKECYKLVSGPGVEILELPWYRGLKQMIKKIIPVLSVYLKSCKGCDCCIFRIAQMESFFVFLFGGGRKLPYAVEVVNDPATFTDMPTLMRNFSIRMVEYMCKNAIAASYVTKKYLQTKYPNVRGFQTHYSSISLNWKDIYKEAKVFNNKNPMKIVHISNAINGDVKGHSTLIKATHYAIVKGIKLEVICVGDGTAVDYFKDMAKDLGIADKINFIGRVNGRNAMLELLRECDLMVLPTRMEGLPRTIIEAMAVGLPCLSTPIAGVPELLDKEYMFAPDDYKGFGEMIIRLNNSPDEMHKMSLRNLECAKDYTDEILSCRREQLYKVLKSFVR